MADPGKSIRTYLQTKSTVTDLTSTRMFPDHLPQNTTLPAMTYAVVSTNGPQHMTASAGYSDFRVQLDCYADTYAAAQNLAEQIRLVMHGYSGAMGTDTVDVVQLANGFSSYDDPIDGSDKGRHVYVLEWRLWVAETIPSL